MGFEVDFLPVGEKGVGGDAIALRYGDLYGDRSEQTVIVIDGGYKSSGAPSLVKCIEECYKTDTIDYVIATHPDSDHVDGLEIVLGKFKIGQLLMHLPWSHSQELAKWKANDFEFLSDNPMLMMSLQDVSRLEELANENGIPITEPFCGVSTEDGFCKIVGPTQEYYESLLPEIMPQSILDEPSLAAEEDVLHDNSVTSASNNSSVISMLSFDNFMLLFTGDAGIPALGHARDLLAEGNFKPGALLFMQIPHHGSRHNVGPTILDHLLGPTGQEVSDRIACVSVPKMNPEKRHPSKSVLNAFQSRGYEYYATQGLPIWIHYDAPSRDNYSCKPILI